MVTFFLCNLFMVVRQSLLRFEFPKDFSLSTNPKHFSKTDELSKFLKEVIKPYVIKQRHILKLSANQKALIIIDAFTRQMTTPVLNAIKEATIFIADIPANLTNFFRPLNLMVNGHWKQFFKRKFNEWYSDQMKVQLDNGADIDEIQVVLQLTKLKPVYASWIVEFFNHMSTLKGKEIIGSGWKSAGIFDTLELGSIKVSSIDPL